MNHLHEIEVCYNGGWDDDPDWKVVCTCMWEAWNRPSEVAAREAWAEHHAEVLLTGACGCPTCQGAAC